MSEAMQTRAAWCRLRHSVRSVAPSLTPTPAPVGLPEAFSFYDARALVVSKAEWLDIDDRDGFRALLLPMFPEASHAGVTTRMALAIGGFGLDAWPWFLGAFDIDQFHAIARRERHFFLASARFDLCGVTLNDRRLYYKRVLHTEHPRLSEIAEQYRLG